MSTAPRRPLATRTATDDHDQGDAAVGARRLPAEQLWGTTGPAARIDGEHQGAVEPGRAGRRPLGYGPPGATALPDRIAEPTGIDGPQPPDRSH